MTAVETEMKAVREIDSSAPSAGASSRGAMLARVIEVFDRENLPYCILHGYATYPDEVEGDVDLLVAKSVDRKLARALNSLAESSGMRIVQWFDDRARLIVLSTRGKEGSPPIMLQLHVSGDYEVADRVICAAHKVLDTRRRHAHGFWIPAAHVEFISVLANRLAKGSLQEKHTQQLSGLWSTERDLCGRELFRFFCQDSARRIADAAEGGDWGRVLRVIPRLRRELLRRATMNQPGKFVMRVMGRQARRIERWTSPKSGMHVVFLGPDGVGKSTVIDAVKERVADAFLTVKYQTFARGILPTRPKASPHALPPRSLPASLVKAAWWLVCYTGGYYKSVYPTIARGGLAINHRYLLDAIVDPKRYRYSGPVGLLKLIWAIAPKPHLIVVLDAPAEIIHARKRETTLEETVRQCEGYRSLVGVVKNARRVDTSQSPAKTIDDVTELILGEMARRMARRSGEAN